MDNNSLAAERPDSRDN